MHQPAADAKQAVASAGGKALALATRGMAALRPAAKPLHPRGELVAGLLQRHGSSVPSGSPWVDHPGRDEVVARLSRAVGLPDALPDIHGLAVRVLGPQGDGDILLASTGWGRFGRHVLTAGRRPGSRPLTTLLPYRTSRGAVLLGARESTPRTFELSWSRAGGSWHHFAELRLEDASHPDQPISFDPVRNQLPGLEQYPWVVRLREPAYLKARRSRGA
jgi:hypothetical protein